MAQKDDKSKSNGDGIGVVEMKCHVEDTCYSTELKDEKMASENCSKPFISQGHKVYRAKMKQRNGISSNYTLVDWIRTRALNLARKEIRQMEKETKNLPQGI